MKSLTLRRLAASAVAATALCATFTAPAQAGRGWHHGGYHGGWHHGYHHGGDAGWWALGAAALIGTGLYLAATAQPPEPEIPYTPAPPPDYSPGYAPPPPPPAPDQYSSQDYYNQYDPSYDGDTAQSPATYPVAPTYNAPAPRSASAGRTDCHRYAINQSGYDPATRSQWTTQVQVDAYQRALQACQAG